MYYVSEDLAEDYARILHIVRDRGLEVAPRGLSTREILSFTLCLRDPTRALARGTGRKIHTGLAAAEALQLVGGFSDPGAMSRISPHLTQFTDGGVFHAPYGPRTSSQIQPAIDWFRRDKDTRKAWVQVWDPMQDLMTGDTRDHPCTTAIQFMIRDDRLNAHVFMRANDAWRGFPYDVFQFCQLQLAVADCLRIEPGIYFHHATSFHLYEDNLEQVSTLEQSSQPAIPGIQISPASLPHQWIFHRGKARRIFYNQQPNDMNTGETLMHTALRRAGIEGEW